MNKKYFETKTGSLEEKITQIAKEQPTITKQEPQIKLEVKNTYFDTKPGSIADLAAKIVSEGLDPVNKDAVKKKFDDRKDKDIDNDGDVDSSDKFLHKRRKAISKAVKEEKDCGPGMYYCKTSGTCKPLSMKKEAVMPDDKGEKINQMKHQKAKEGEKEIVKPVSEKVECPQCKGKGCAHCDGKGYHMKEETSPAEKIAALRVRQMKLQTKVRDMDQGDPKNKTPMAIAKNDLDSIQRKMDDLKKQGSKQEKKTYSELRKETKEIQLGDKGKTLTGKNAPKIDVEPRANPI
ncbi:MAG: hypothetical protein VXA18_05420 [Gammaproteobacteria bacterium]